MFQSLPMKTRLSCDYGDVTVSNVIRLANTNKPTAYHTVLHRVARKDRVTVIQTERRTDQTRKQNMQHHTSARPPASPFRACRSRVCAAFPPLPRAARLPFSRDPPDAWHPPIVRRRIESHRTYRTTQAINSTRKRFCLFVQSTRNHETTREKTNNGHSLTRPDLSTPRYVRLNVLYGARIEL